MKRLFSLIKVVFKTSLQEMNLTNTFRSKKKKSKLKTAVTMLLIVALIGYLGAIIFVPVYHLLKMLIEIGQPSLLLWTVYTILPVVSLFFMILSVPSVFYFARDVENYLSLPFEPWEITTAKFISAYIQALISGFIFIVPVYINYLLLVKPGINFLFFGSLAALIMPIIPLSIAVALAVMLMRFVPFMKNKNLFIYLNTAIIFIPTFIISFSFGALSNEVGFLDKIVESIVNMDDNLFKTVNMFFPTSKMLTIGVIESKITYLMLALLISLAVSALTILITQPLYYKGVIGIDEQKSKKRRLRLNELESNIRVNSIYKSLMMNDLKNILRTPAFALNYFSPMFIFPIIGIMSLVLNPEILGIINENLPIISIKFKELVTTLPLIKQIEYPLFIGIGIGIFFSNTESSSATAISREGHDIKQYITYPLLLSDLAHAKAYLSILLSSILPVLLTLISAVVLKPNPLIFFIFIFGLGLGILFSTYVSLIIDILSPRLNWVSEQQAIKGNFVQVISILAMMAFPVVFLILSLYSPSIINVVIGLFGVPLIIYVLIKYATTAANTKLLNRIQNL